MQPGKSLMTWRMAASSGSARRQERQRRPHRVLPVKFDLPGRRPQRFRLLYREVDNVTLKIVAVGVRDQHAIYRSAVARLRP